MVVSITCKLFVYLDRAKVLHILFITSITFLWFPLSQKSLLYWYYENTDLKIVWFFLIFSSHLKVFIHLPCINTQRKTTTAFSLLSPLSWVSLIYLYYKNTVLRFMWYCLVFIQLNFKFTFIYPASTHSDEQQHHSATLPSNHIITTKQKDCIRGQSIILREIITLI